MRGTIFVKFMVLTTILSIQLSCQARADNGIQSIETTLLGTQKANNTIQNAINNLGYKLLLNMMKEKRNQNIIISPTGIAGLLAMTLLGSAGTTHNEIAEALGFSQEKLCTSTDILKNRKNHEQFGALLQTLNTNISSKTVYADAIFVDTHAPLRELYRHYINDVYRGHVLSTDFKQSEDVKNYINEWVKSHTEGNIEQFLRRPVPTSTKVILLSALYFSGQWEQPFIQEYTRKMSFKRSSDEIMADFMLNFGHFRYIFSEKYDFHLIALPYNDSVTTMYALKPRFPKRITLLELMERIDYDLIDDIINLMTHKECVVRFPKMELKSSTNLENILKTIGVKTMFIPGEANFALMIDSNVALNQTEEEIMAKIKNGTIQTAGVANMLDRLPNPGIHVDSILHDVKMIINEYGTEAVAATSGILARSAEQFYADSPFYIFIRNERTKLVTFSAVVFDPTM